MTDLIRSGLPISVAVLATPSMTMQVSEDGEHILIGDIMRKIFLYMTMTFDGFIAGQNNDLDWFTPPMNDEELNKDIVEIVEDHRLPLADSGLLMAH